MYGYKAWFDCETSGIEKNDQILEYSILIEDSSGKIVDELHQTLRLRPGLVPSFSALMINNINPFSKEWEKNSVTEWQAAFAIKNLVKKYDKPFFIAYKADFDFNYLKNLLDTCGLNFNDYFNDTIVDPYKTAKSLIVQNKLKTVEKINKRGEKYWSATLSDVAKALNLDTKVSGPLHRSKTDTELLRICSHKLFKMATGFKLSELYSDNINLKENTWYEIISNSFSSGISFKNIYICKNLTEIKKIIAFDESKNKLIYLNYGTIIKSKLIEKKSIEVNYTELQKLESEIFKKESDLILKQKVKEIEYLISNSHDLDLAILQAEQKLLAQKNSIEQVKFIINQALSLSAAMGKKNIKSRTIKDIQDEVKKCLNHNVLSLELIKEYNLLLKTTEISPPDIPSTSPKEPEVFQNLSALSKPIKLPENELAWNSRFTAFIYNTDTKETYKKEFYFYEHINSAKIISSTEVLFNVKKDFKLKLLEKNEFFMFTKDFSAELYLNPDNEMGSIINDLLPLKNLAPIKTVHLSKPAIDPSIKDFLFSDHEVKIDVSSLNEAAVKAISLWEENSSPESWIKNIQNIDFVNKIIWDKNLNFEEQKFYAIKFIKNGINSIKIIKVLQVSESSIVGQNWSQVLALQNKGISPSIISLMTEELLPYSQISQIKKI